MSVATTTGPGSTVCSTNRGKVAGRRGLTCGELVGPFRFRLGTPFARSLSRSACRRVWSCPLHCFCRCAVVRRGSVVSPRRCGAPLGRSA
eukprot:3595620-Pleurochrysis_carterae.AAC.1